MYHGGDMNGVSTGLLMLHASEIMEELIAEIVACCKPLTVTDDKVKMTCRKWGKSWDTWMP